MVNEGAKGGLEHLVVTSDLQDYGSAISNLNVTKTFLDYVSNTFDSASVLFQGDVLDEHATRPAYFLEKEVKKQNAQLIQSLLSQIPEEQAQQIVEQVKENPEGLRTLMITAYLQYFNSIVEGAKQKGLSVYGFMGNNEPFLSGAFEKEDVIQYENDFKNQVAFDYADGFTQMNGLNVYAKSFWDISVQTQEGMQTIDYTTDSSNLEESVVYAELDAAENAPQLISLHGPPAIYKNITKGENNELKGLDKYIDEYKGDDPLVVSFGHQGKAGHQIIENSQGSQIIYLCTNNNSNQGTAPQGTSFDIVSEGGKIQRIDKINYGYYEEAA